MIGHAGFGRDGDDFIEENMVYCMGGTGVIFSNRIIRSIRPALATCVKNLFTDHEDIEIGRCIWRHTGVRCTVRNYCHVVFSITVKTKHSNCIISNVIVDSS